MMRPSAESTVTSYKPRANNVMISVEFKLIMFFKLRFPNLRWPMGVTAKPKTPRQNQKPSRQKKKTLR